MPKTLMIAEYLRSCAHWRIDRADERDDGRNARSAIGLLDAAAYTMLINDSERAVVRMAVAGCFAVGRFNPGPEGERIIRAWHYEDADGDPADLLAAIADAAERGLRHVPPTRRPRAALGWPAALLRRTGLA